MSGRGEAVTWSAIAHVAADGIRRSGKTPDDLLRRNGLIALTDTPPTVPLLLSQVVQLFEESAAYTSNPDFGLLRGTTITPLDLGPVGLVFLSPPTLGEALSSFLNHVGLLQDGSRSELVVNGDRCYFIYRIEVPTIQSRRQDAEFTVSCTLSLIRSLLGSDWHPQEVHFEHRCPYSIDTHEKIFGAPIYFQQQFNALVFPSADLNIPCGDGERRFFPMMEHYLSLLHQKQTEPPSVLARASALMTGMGEEGSALTSVEISARLGTSRRTLQRAYQKNGQTFSQAKAEKQKSLAQYYLGQTDLPITEIAFMLNYADAACFTRAFRRWFGILPSEYRRQQTAPR